MGGECLREREREKISNLSCYLSPTGHFLQLVLPELLLYHPGSHRAQDPATPAIIYNGGKINSKYEFLKERS